jgi:hypothetical protein
VQRIVVEDHRIIIEHVVPSGPLRLQPEHHAPAGPLWRWRFFNHPPPSAFPYQLRRPPVHQHITKSRLLGGLLLASCLAGCTPPLYSHTDRRLTCPCPATQAVTYATQAVFAYHGTPVFSTPTRLHFVRPNPDGQTVTKLLVTIVPTGAETAEVRVQTETPAPAHAWGERVAEAFVAGFAAAAQGTP